MYTDKEKIDDCLMPGLLIGIINAHIRKDPDCAIAFTKHLETFHGAVERSLAGHSRDKLTRRLDRAMHNVSAYFVRNKFNTLKALVTIIRWNKGLIEKEAIFVLGGKQHEEILDSIDKGLKKISEGHGITNKQEKEHAINEFILLERSAKKHIPKLHKHTQSLGLLSHCDVTLE